MVAFPIMYVGVRWWLGRYKMRDPARMLPPTVTVRYITNRTIKHELR